MLHGAGIFTNICPNKITRFVGFCRQIYQHHGAYVEEIPTYWCFMSGGFTPAVSFDLQRLQRQPFVSCGKRHVMICQSLARREKKGRAQKELLNPKVPQFETV